MNDVTEVLGNAIDAVLTDYRNGKLTSTAAVAAIALGMDDTHDLLDPELEGFDQATTDLVTRHIEKLQEART
jgi:hypothetical protein